MAKKPTQPIAAHINQGGIRHVLGTGMIRAYALLASPPNSLKFSEHQLKFQGLDPELQVPGLVWGVYGTNSIDVASSLASMDARASGRRAYFLDLNYPMNPETIITPTSPAVKRAEVLSWCKARLHLDDADEEAKSKDLGAFLRQHPMVAQAYMRNHPDVTAMIMDVELPSRGEPLILQIVVARKRLAKDALMCVRYHQDIKLTI